jgi:hypothetical protein
VTARKKMKGNGVNPAPGRPIYRGPLNLSVAVPSTTQNAPTALSREIREKIKAEFSPTDYNYDLNLSLGRKPKRQYQVVLMENHFCKLPHHINIGLWQIILPNRPST